jgi:hypothetical protein
VSFYPAAASKLSLQDLPSLNNPSRMAPESKASAKVRDPTLMKVQEPPRKEYLSLSPPPRKPSKSTSRRIPRAQFDVQLEMSTLRKELYRYKESEEITTLRKELEKKKFEKVEM